MLATTAILWLQSGADPDGGRSPPKNVRKELCSSWFCAIQKTTFAIKGHFVAHCFVATVLWRLYFYLAVSQPLWDLTMNCWNRPPPKMTGCIRLAFSCADHAGGKDSWSHLFELSLVPGLQMWLFQNLAFLTHSALFEKKRENLAFLSRKGLTLTKHCLSYTLLTNLFWRESMNMQDIKNIAKILLLH